MTEDARTLLNVTCVRVQPADEAARERAWARLDSLTKPPRSLARLEETAADIVAVLGGERPELGGKAVLVAAADHGVCAQGVAAYPQEVTAQMVANFAAGGAAICAIARSVGARLLVADVGVATGTVPEGVRDERVAAGTRDMTAGPATTREEALAALASGVRLADELADEGVGVLGLGEMGIGNTTAAAALTSAYVGVEPEDVVGPGTGLNADGVALKARVVREALARNAAELEDPLGTLAAVGGLEIAALAGAAIGMSARGGIVVVDGFVSTSAVLAAVAMCPAVADRVFASHLSPEPGHAIALASLRKRPLLDLGMRLGEGTGAALAMPLLDAAAAMLREMATFAEAGVSGRDEGEGTA